MFNRLLHMLQKLPHSEIPELYFPEADFRDSFAEATSLLRILIGSEFIVRYESLQSSRRRTMRQATTYRPRPRGRDATFLA